MMSKCNSLAGQDQENSQGTPSVSNAQNAIRESMLDAILKIQNLHIKKQGKDILKGINLTLQAGQIMAIVGESGSGKTTLLEAIADGHALTSMSPEEHRLWLAREVGYIPQHPEQALYPLYTIEKQWNYLNQLLDIPVKRDRFLNDLKGLGFSDPEFIMKAYPHQLSGGMAQRVALLFALFKGPKLILADEPTSALDSQNEAYVMDYLSQTIEKTGASLLMVTHSLGLAAQFANYIMVMKEGRIVEEGPTAQIMEEPQEDYTQRLIASILE